MNNEQQELLSEAYMNYTNKTNEDFFKSDITLPPSYYPIDKDKFINKCKTDPEFSERWGLKIEERELSLEERIIFAGYDYENRGGIGWNMLKESVDLDNSIPRKLITITYNDKTIESYE